MHRTNNNSVAGGVVEEVVEVAEVIQPTLQPPLHNPSNNLSNNLSITAGETVVDFPVVGSQPTKCINNDKCGNKGENGHNSANSKEGDDKVGTAKRANTRGKHSDELHRTQDANEKMEAFNKTDAVLQSNRGNAEGPSILDGSPPPTYRHAALRKEPQDSSGSPRAEEEPRHHDSRIKKFEIEMAKPSPFLHSSIPYVRKDSEHCGLRKFIHVEGRSTCNRLEVPQDGSIDRSKTSIDKSEGLQGTAELPPRQREFQPLHSSVPKPGSVDSAQRKDRFAELPQRRRTTSVPERRAFECNKGIHTSHNRPDVNAIHRRGLTMIGPQEISEGSDEQNNIVLSFLTNNAQSNRTCNRDQENCAVDQGPPVDYPLYAPFMNVINLSKIAKLLTHDELHILEWLSSANPYLYVMKYIPRAERIRYKNPQMLRYVEQMLSAGLIRRTDSKTVKCWCRVFALPEERKKRLRLIVDPRQLNGAVKLHFDRFNLRTKFPSRSDIHAMIMRSSSIVESDFKCWYYQIPIAECVQPFFGIDINGQAYVLTRVAMGFSAAVKVANTISRAIARAAMSEPCQPLIQVDNIYFPNKTLHDDRPMKQLQKICDDTGVTIGALQQFTIGDVLGVTYNLTTKTARLSQKFFDKHSELVDTCFNQSSEMPAIVFWRLVAVLIRASYVLQQPLCYYYYAMLKVRKVAGQIFHGMNWSAIVGIEEVCWRQLRELRDDVWHQVEAPIRQSSFGDTIVFSDASDDGYGWVVVDNNNVIVHEGVFDENQRRWHISAKEAFALQHAARTIYKQVPSVTFVVDPTALAFAFEKGHSGNLAINATISTLKGKFPSCRVLRMPGVGNPADAPSRGRDLSPSVVEAAILWYENEVDTRRTVLRQE